MTEKIIAASYAEFLSDLKSRIKTARIRAALSVNRELIRLYWEIGCAILKRQEESEWGDKILNQLVVDLNREFPDMKGFSKTNLKYMRGFASAYPEFGQQPVDQIPWGHNIAIITKIKDSTQREWYIRKAVEQGWSRSVLVHQIESNLYNRQGGGETNFDRTLSSPQSDLARELLKDPYSFDFLTLHENALERDLEGELLKRLREFMLELGVGFAFVGSQYPLEVGGDMFYPDLLFYHLQLRCFVVVELKMAGFKPEYAGKMNFYLQVIDDLLRHEADAPTIGILLCKGKNRVVVEYALRGMNKPIGVSEYELAQALPELLKGTLTTVEQFESELGNE